ncbi:metal-dependent hydrolase [Halobacillus sp. A1]|uniref:metal-dependent hydrolase n=1 Tax=Halobacillus sp. A1 TaxID=2880262 RepID=UPI0020A6CD8E|nr:metal-dependent hydrolase [Halobacillus sp. A1]MCP3029779.1 metal-dependent hydrolase [Halobacillus sp. A1]
MMASGHQALGFTSGLLTLAILPGFGVMPDTPLEAVLFFSFVMIGSLLPDIDTPHSKLGQKFWRGIMITLMFALGMYLFAPDYLDVYREELKIFVFLCLPLLIMVKSHRKMTHSISFLVLLGLYHMLISGVWDIPSFYFIGFIAGVLSHLIGDYMTKRGIPVFYPFVKKYFRFFITFRTGSLTEKLMILILSMWNLWYLVSQVF